MKRQIYTDSVTKIILVVFIVAISYIILSLIIYPFFIQEPQTMFEMHRMMIFSRQNNIPNILSLVIALVIGLLASFQIKTRKGKRKTSKERALDIVKKKLSKDEKIMLKEIEKTGTITQDSLRARLEWSKAKISTILTRLDKMNIIQRERQGKTYKIFLSKDLK